MAYAINDQERTSQISGDNHTGLLDRIFNHITQLTGHLHFRSLIILVGSLSPSASFLCIAFFTLLCLTFVNHPPSSKWVCVIHPFLMIECVFMLGGQIFPILARAWWESELKLETIAELVIYIYKNA
jgi:hypothetical protein